MKLRNKLGITLVFQLVGVGATALANMVVAQRYGPDGQGYLSYYRSIVDFLANVGLFGFPQAFVYMINSKIIGSDWAVKFSTYYGLLFGLVSASVGLLLSLSGVRDIHGLNTLAIFSIIVAATGLLLHGMYRAVSLSTKSIHIFNLISILPAVLTFILYLFWHPDDYQALVMVLVLASVVSTLLAAFFLKGNLASNRIRLNEILAKIKKAVEYGSWSFVPGIALSLTTASTYGLLRQGGRAEATAGQFSVSFVLVSTAILPLNMVIPVLFDTWSKEVDREASRQSYLKLSHLGSLLAILGSTLGMALVGPVTNLVFGASFSLSVLSTRILLLGVYALYQSRLLSAMLLAIGNPDSVAIGAIIRAVMIILPMYLGLTNSLAGAAYAWTIGEFVSMFYMSAAVCKKTGWSLPQVAGISLYWMVGTLKSISVRMSQHL